MPNAEILEVSLDGPLYAAVRDVADFADVPIEHIIRVALAHAFLPEDVSVATGTDD